MIGRREAARWAQQFGVAVEQIRRDHLVSHVLAVLPEFGTGPDVAFVGGTALARTHLDGLRLSEDIDLLVDDVSGSAEAPPAPTPRPPGTGRAASLQRGEGTGR